MIKIHQYRLQVLLFLSLLIKIGTESILLILCRDYPISRYSVLMRFKNELGQSELALNELNFKTLKERRTQFVASLMLMHKITRPKN